MYNSQISGRICAICEIFEVFDIFELPPGDLKCPGN
jgi:hypothetical protein